MSDELIRFDPTGAFLDRGGTSRDDIAGWRSRIEEARDEVLADAQLWADGVDPPVEKRPLDAGFHYLPERLLTELGSRGDDSEVVRLRACADRLSRELDSVVVLGIGGSYMGARALFEACCHHYYNEVAAAMRRGRPRIYFEGNNVDNDAVLDLLRLLQSRGDRWGIVVISKSGGTLEAAAAFRVLLRDLRASLGDQVDQLGKIVTPVTGRSGKLFDLSQAIGCQDMFHVPDGVGGRFSVLSAVGLLPAALMGLDIVRLLEGARAMNEHFAAAEVGENAVLDYASVCTLLEETEGCQTRVLSTWGKRLEALGLWYDQLLSESLGKDERGALPLTVVNTRDLHSRGQQHQEGRRDKVITNLLVDRESTSREPLAVGHSEYNQDQLNELADKTLPEILHAAAQGANEAYRDASRPTTDLHLPQINEHTMGQLFQMLMLATVLEGRMIRINPYGQPGVEAYKQNMNAILRGK